MPDINKNMRSAMLRLSEKNKLNIDNEKLNLHAGDVYTYTKNGIIYTLNEWVKTKYFSYFMIEHNADENNLHWHIIIEFAKTSEAKFQQIKDRFPYGDIENCKFGVKSCVQYLTHQNHLGKHQYSYDEVITNAPDKLELYKLPGKTTMDAKLLRTLDKILSGEIKEFETEKIDPNIYLRYQNKIKTAFEYRQKTLVTNPARNITVVALIGPPRVGKSTYCKVWAQKHNKSICFSSSSRDPFQDYMGQDCFVYDDMCYEDTKIQDLLKALDPHNNTTVSARYKNRLFIGDTIFIASNTPITEWYRTEDILLRDALYKRISCVLEFGDLMEDKTVQYYISKIEYSGEMDFIETHPRVYHDYKKMILVHTEEAPRVFDLKKYIDVSADESRMDDFIGGLGDI